MKHLLQSYHREFNYTTPTDIGNYDAADSLDTFKAVSLPHCVILTCFNVGIIQKRDSNVQ